MKKLVLIVGVVVLLAGGGAGGWWWWSQRAEAAGAQTEAPKPAEPKETGVIVLDPFLVNLADKESPRFLRVSLQLVVDNKELATAFAEKGEANEHAVEKVRLRSAVLELLTTQTADQLVTADGKKQLKKAIAQAASHALHETKVVDVLFTDFVVQF